MRERGKGRKGGRRGGGAERRQQSAEEHQNAPTPSRRAGERDARTASSGRYASYTEGTGASALSAARAAMGGDQELSRLLLSKVVPREREREYRAAGSFLLVM